MKALLSKQQNKIAGLVACGCTTKEIACELNVSVHTIDNTLRTIYQKSGCRKIHELAVWWFAKYKNIEIDLPKLKQELISMSLLLLIVFNTIQSPDNQMLRVRRIRTRKTESEIIDEK